MNITCCRDCKPPKRYPGCGANCAEYKEQKKNLEDEKAERMKFIERQRWNGVFRGR